MIYTTFAKNHTYDMVYTEDLSSITRFTDGRMAIVEGRALTKDDSSGGAQVCVISDEFSKRNGVGIGD